MHKIYFYIYSDYTEIIEGSSATTYQIKMNFKSVIIRTINSIENKT